MGLYKYKTYLCIDFYGGYTEQYYKTNTRYLHIYILGTYNFNELINITVI